MEVGTILYLDRKDIIKAVEPEEVMDVIENAYAMDLEGNYYMPHRMHVNKGPNTLLYMPCFTGDVFGTKILSLFPGNAKHGKPVISGVVILNDAETGTPQAILDGAVITGLRTGAVGGVAVRHTAPDYLESLGLIGSGAQGFFQVYFACKARPTIKEVFLYDLSTSKIKLLQGKLKQEFPGIAFKSTTSSTELLSKTSLIITATPSNEPVLPDDPKLLQNKHYIGIGSYKPDMREYPRAIYNLVKNVFIDTEHGFEESGDMIIPLRDNWVEQDFFVKMGELIKNKERYETKRGTTFFKSVGMALFDITVSEYIYEQALIKGLGTKIK